MRCPWVRAVTCLLTAAAAALVYPEEEDQGAAVQVSLLQQQAARAPPPHAAPPRKVKTTVVDLNLPPFERWQAFYRQEREDIASIVLSVRDTESAEDVDKAKLLEKRNRFLAGSWKALLGHQEYIQELRGIVAAINHPNVTLEHLLLTELAYEFGDTVGCTGLLASTPNGTVFHGRNLDLFNGQEQRMLRQLLEVTFVRDGKPLIVSTGFIGTVGISTGYRIGAYSIAQNTRRSAADTDANLAMANSGGKAFTLSVRQIMEEVPDFKTAVQRLSRVPLLAPQYFTLAGPGPWEGALITRDREGTSAPWANVLMLNPKIDRWFLVQTNDDIMHKPLDHRRNTAISKLKHMRQEDISTKTMLGIMQTMPVLNEGTMFTWVVTPTTNHRILKFGDAEIRNVIHRQQFHVPGFHLSYSRKHS